MKNLLIAIAKAFMIILIGREAMAVSFVTPDLCPTTDNNDTLDGSKFCPQYKAKYHGNTFQFGNNKWEVTSRQDIDESTSYKFIGAQTSEYNPVIVCRYRCYDKSSCNSKSSVDGDVAFTAGMSIDPDIDNNAQIMTKVGLWRHLKSPDARVHRCGLIDSIPHKTEDCGFNFAYQK